jgi:predicted ribosome quality control (RQC) complex YloA/Tae2 family protein
MKQRFDGLDVTAMVAHLQRTLLGRRVVNVYDGENSDTYVLKLDGSGDDASNAKTFLCLQSGIRFHDFTHFQAEAMPSPFCAKLRKHLKGLRLEQLQQVGQDRVVLFHFLGASGKHSIILELYAKGNLILTDADYSILALLRSHIYQADQKKQETEEQVAVKVGSVYPVTYAADVGKDVADNDNETKGLLSADPQAWAQGELEASANSKKALTLKTLLLKQSSGASQYGPTLLEHCILYANLPPHQALKELTLTSSQWQALQEALRTEAPAVLERLQQAATSVAPGYLIYEDIKPSASDKPAVLLPLHPGKMLLEFQPHILKQHESRPYLETTHFGQAVYDFYSQLQAQKAVLKAHATEKTVKNKLEKARQDQEERLQALADEQDALFRQAKTVERQATTVDQALAIINSALNSGMDWDQLAEIVQVEKENQNPIALLIMSLRLESDIMVLRLPIDPFVDPEGETVNVEISLKETAHANASRLFTKYRNSKDKAQKTTEAADKALKAAEESAKRQLSEAQKKTRQSPALTKRKAFWFEKFHWFITSDNYLVVGGKDAHMNETLVKRYLRPGDAYLHADVHGASSCILRAKRRRTKTGNTVPIPLPEQALREAGNFTICHSSAWASRMVTSAWWVEFEQVTKTAPTGEYLTVGSFMIRGKKTFLPPTQLEMGLAVLFRLGDEESIVRHQNERRDFALMALEDEDVDEEDQNNPAEEKELANTKSGKVRTSEQPDAEKDYEDASGNDNASGDDDAEDDGQVMPTTAKKRGLSARDRRLIKKYGSLEEAERILSARSGEDNDSVSVSAASIATTTETQPVAKRGKKAKQKRTKKKYADQDDEDRELALMLLHGVGKDDKQKYKSKQKVAEPSETQQMVAAETSAVLKKDVSKLLEGLDDAVRKELADCVAIEDAAGTITHEWQKIETDIIEQLLALQPQEAQLAATKRLRSLTTINHVDNLSMSLSGIIRTIRRHGYENLERKIEEDKEKAANGPRNTANRDDGFSPALNTIEADEDVGDDTAEVSKLTGKPTSDDVLTFAIPVFAPYQTLSKYALRVKLTPGNMKRGKAAKQALDMLLAVPGQDPHDQRLREMIKHVNDNDWVQSLISDVKISAAGASKAQKQQKAKSKKKKGK